MLAISCSQLSMLKIVVRQMSLNSNQQTKSDFENSVTTSVFVVSSVVSWRSEQIMIYVFTLKYELNIMPLIDKKKRHEFREETVDSFDIAP